MGHEKELRIRRVALLYNRKWPADKGAVFVIQLGILEKSFEKATVLGKTRAENGF